MKIPKPGKPVRGSQTGRPIMALLDLLGRRWTLRIIWELREEELSFLELQARCDAMSSSTLVQRLAELTEAKIIQQEPATNHYRLSSEGIELLNSLLPLNDFAQRWTEKL